MGLILLQAGPYIAALVGNLLMELSSRYQVNKFLDCWEATHLRTSWTILNTVSVRGGHVKEAHIHLMKQTHSAGHVAFAHTPRRGSQIFNILVHLIQQTKGNKMVQYDSED